MPADEFYHGDCSLRRDCRAAVRRPHRNRPARQGMDRLQRRQRPKGQRYFDWSGKAPVDNRNVVVAQAGQGPQTHAAEHTASGCQTVFTSNHYGSQP